MRTGATTSWLETWFCWGYVRDVIMFATESVPVVQCFVRSRHAYRACVVVKWVLLSFFTPAISIFEKDGCLNFKDSLRPAWVPSYFGEFFPPFPPKFLGSQSKGRNLIQRLEKWLKNTQFFLHKCECAITSKIVLTFARGIIACEKFCEKCPTVSWNKYLKLSPWKFCNI